MTRDIDRLISELRRFDPAIQVEQLRVLHPGADDDGIWFVTHPRFTGDIQVESSTGSAPFLIESDNDPPVTVGTVGEAADILLAQLGLRERTA